MTDFYRSDGGSKEDRDQRFTKKKYEHGGRVCECVSACFHDFKRVCLVEIRQDHEGEVARAEIC